MSAVGMKHINKESASLSSVSAPLKYWPDGLTSGGKQKKSSAFVLTNWQDKRTGTVPSIVPRAVRLPQQILRNGRCALLRVLLRICRKFYSYDVKVALKMITSFFHFIADRFKCSLAFLFMACVHFNVFNSLLLWHISEEIFCWFNFSSWNNLQVKIFVLHSTLFCNFAGFKKYAIRKFSQRIGRPKQVSINRL